MLPSWSGHKGYTLDADRNLGSPYGKVLYIDQDRNLSVYVGDFR